MQAQEFIDQCQQEEYIVPVACNCTEDSRDVISDVLGVRVNTTSLRHVDVGPDCQLAGGGC
jgi:hypothetical protein